VEVRSVKRIGRWEEWGDGAPRRQREREQRKEETLGVVAKQQRDHPPLLPYTPIF
jgi:hypothetical protein